MAVRKMISKGQEFERLTVVEEGPFHPTSKRRTIICSCKCGTARVLVLLTNLTRGHSRSCGCLQSEVRGKSKITHGMSHSPEERIWNTIKQRCYNPKTINYKNYGGRGIKVCRRWLGPLGFKNFYSDMGARPSPKFTVERIRNSKDYSPNNCKWATRLEQGSNKRNNRNITHNGETLTVSQWARRIGIQRRTLSRRLDDYGFSIERALTKPVRKSWHN